jgi:hypothetical protein
VRSAVITTIGEEHSKEQLVAYIVSKEKLTPAIEELSEFLKKKLPDYMVPSAFIFLDALPLSANGKVDRRALPTQESLLQKVEVAYVAPQTDIEQIIASVWQELLGVEKVGLNDNFFDLGGNSLLLTKTYSEFKKRLPNGVQSFSLIDLFNYSTIKSLSQHLAQNGQITAFPPKAAELEQKLNQGKERLKQRFNKSRLASR